MKRRLLSILVATTMLARSGVAAWAGIKTGAAVQGGTLVQQALSGDRRRSAYNHPSVSHKAYFNNHKNSNAWSSCEATGKWAERIAELTLWNETSWGIGC
jgi:hypothetical protein